jgi:hypothetical protein
MLVDLDQAYGDMTNEQKALMVSANKGKLISRLLAAKSVLTNVCRRDFGKGNFDFDRKRLVSQCGTWALQWQTRLYPNEPESYENQQTSVGSVVVTWLKPKTT